MSLLQVARASQVIPTPGFGGGQVVVKYAVPPVLTSWMPSWLFSSGGGGSSSGGSYSASYKAVGTAGGSSTPISSAYGSA